MTDVPPRFCLHCGMPLGPDMRTRCAHDRGGNQALPYQTVPYGSATDRNEP